jgi:choice-of-anchor C domain-containing protein
MKPYWLALAVSLIVAPTAANAASVITNGSFETGNLSNPATFSTLGAGSTDLTGWTINSGSIDYIGGYWEAQEGDRSLDMSGLGAGSISQDFATTPGQAYNVSFYVAANPDGGPDAKGLRSAVGGDNGQIVSVDVFYPTVASTRPGPMNFVPVAYSFIADSATTTLSFLSLVGTPFGMALDNVSVSAVPLPPALLLLGSGLVGLGLLGRRKRNNAATAA